MMSFWHFLKSLHGACRSVTQGYACLDKKPHAYRLDGNKRARLQGVEEPPHRCPDRKESIWITIE